LKDNIIGVPKFHPKSCKEGKLFSWISLKALKKHVSSEEFKNLVVNNPEKKEALRKLADSLSETDNPVLIIVTPKE